MRTTVEIDDALLARAQRRSPTTTKRALIEEALRALIRESARQQLVAAGGTMPDLEEVRRRRRGDG